MAELTYLVNWGKNKETAWSGTNYSLYKALQKYYSIKDVNLKGNRWINAFLHRILRLNTSVIGFYQKRMQSFRLRDTKGKVFQFAEVLYNRPGRDTYMYVDLTVSHVNYLRKNQPDVYAVSAYQNSDPRIFEKRAKEQDEYIRTCSGLFTMGHWLKDWLVEQGFPASRIHAVGGGINVDSSLIDPQPKSHNKILFIGKDFKRKGGYITYEAFKLLRK